ncbi:E3 ubiquitin-protein ligase CCNB1IP1-like isoform X2 [Gordionus sp. m RMFG-2023]|uniref:E3 ubiquitin-protein ligase CCNB1IP1-like isoform X2 n=1 Tax=Gordionus sp. m RMFG-2023 TaxID=3053472 RepID=UPI0031FD5860
MQKTLNIICMDIFCDDDGMREFGKNPSICPACNTNLSGKFDVIHSDLSPSEQYKGMVLAGLKPEIILEIASQAMSFWCYQSSQEVALQEHMVNKSKEKIAKLEEYYEELLNKITAEMSSLKMNITNMKKENDNSKQRYTDMTSKYNEIFEKFSEKSRQYQKLQMMYDQLRRNALSKTPMPMINNNKDKNIVDFPLMTRDIIRNNLIRENRTPSYHPEMDEFNFRPVINNINPLPNRLVSTSTMNLLNIDANQLP